MAVRIAGVVIPHEKRIQVALTYIYGIGDNRVLDILTKLKINPDTRTKDLSEDEVSKIRELIRGEYKVEGDLKRDVLSNIKRLKDIKSYRGVRHERHLPVRGQRTKTNSRTKRGNVRKTMASGKKPAMKK